MHRRWCGPAGLRWRPLASRWLSSGDGEWGSKSFWRDQGQKRISNLDSGRRRRDRGSESKFKSADTERRKVPIELEIDRDADQINEYRGFLKDYVGQKDWTGVRAVVAQVRRKNIGELWGEALFAMGKSGDWSTASEMIEEVEKPDLEHFEAALNVLGRFGKVKECENLFPRMKELKVEPRVYTYNLLLRLHARAGDVEQGQKVMNEIREAKLIPNETTWNTMIHLFAVRKDGKGATKLVGEMLDAGHVPSNYTLNPLLHSFINDLQTVLNIFELMIDKAPEKVVDMGTEVIRWDIIVNAVTNANSHGFAPTTYTFNSLIMAFARKKMANHAFALASRLKLHGVKLNLHMYNSLLSAFMSGGQFAQGKKLLDEMTASGVTPTNKSYNILMLGYAVAGEVDLVRETFDSLGEKGIRPTIEQYNALALASIRAGDFDTARQELEQMPIAGNKFTRGMREVTGLEGRTLEVSALVRRGLLDRALKVLELAEEEGAEVEIQARKDLLAAQRTKENSSFETRTRISGIDETDKI